MKPFALPVPRVASLGLRLVLLSLCVLPAVLRAAAEPAAIRLERTPDGGLQPQALVDSAGTTHLIYFKGTPAGGDLYYVRRTKEAARFSPPLRINQEPGSAIAVGTIRGAQLALGRGNRVHVVWNGGAGATKPKLGEKAFTPLLYTRLNAAGTAFERERNIIRSAPGLDGGSTVAADNLGHVLVAWHAPRPGNTNGEAGRTVFVARSADDGATFAAETPAISEPTGACACCGMKGMATREGALCLLFRSAATQDLRSETVLVARSPEAPFEIAESHPWKINTCPMSSATLSEAPGGFLAAWETAGQVYFARVDPKSGRVTTPAAAPGMTKKKHPVAASNSRGEQLLVWTEGTGWSRGGAVAWQLFDAEGKPTEKKGRADGVPVWGLATAFATPDGSFTIVY